jgi:N-methylhydantoinase B
MAAAWKATGCPIEQFSLHEGSGGAGEYRGGFGVNYTVKIRHGEARASFVMDHGRYGPQGALGGRDGGRNKVRIERDGQPDYIPPHLSKDQDIRIAEGDRVHVSTPGGGGFGDPLRRDPEAVLRDLYRGYYTIGEAENLFGVVIAAGKVDKAATKKLRAKQAS